MILYDFGHPACGLHASPGMPYRYVREPLTAEGSDRLSNAHETPTGRLVARTSLGTGLRVSEVCDLTPTDAPLAPLGR